MSAVETVVRDLRPDDWPEVLRIYEEWIADGRWRDTLLLARRSTVVGTD